LQKVRYRFNIYACSYVTVVLYVAKIGTANSLHPSV